MTHSERLDCPGGDKRRSNSDSARRWLHGVFTCVDSVVTVRSAWSATVCQYALRNKSGLTMIWSLTFRISLSKVS